VSDHIKRTIEDRYYIGGLTEYETIRLEALDECLSLCKRQVGSACYAVLDAVEYDILKLIGEIVPLDDDDQPIKEPRP